MSIIEQAGMAAGAYELGEQNARRDLEIFTDKHQAELDALRDEFSDYQDHPLWQDHRALTDATREPGQQYRNWYREALVEDSGWEEKILLLGRHTSHAVAPDTFIADTGALPATVREFDRRHSIVEAVDRVTSFLSEHNGQPIVGVAQYPSHLPFSTAGSREKPDTPGGITATKTRVTVGVVDQTEPDPQLEVDSQRKVDDAEYNDVLRMRMSRGLGTVATYGFPESRLEMRRGTSKPSYRKFTTFGNWKDKKMPMGSSLTGDFSASELRGHDLLVINAPHATASRYPFPDDVLVYRPKQSIQDPAKDAYQSIAVMPTEEGYRARVNSRRHGFALPAARHDSYWLVGESIIQDCLKTLVRTQTTLDNKDRGTDEAIIRAAEDLVEQALESAK